MLTELGRLNQAEKKSPHLADHWLRRQMQTEAFS